MKRALFCVSSLWLGCATVAPATIETPPAIIEFGRLDNGARVVAIGAPHDPEHARDGLELGLFLRLDPELEPLGLEGTSGLLVELATESAGQVGESSPHARALTLGGRLETYVDGALVGWRLFLGPCVEGGPCSATRLRDAWAVLLDVALAPDLRAGTVARRAEQYRDRLGARIDGLGQAAWRWAVALASGYGRPVGATPTDRAASSVNREALVRLHRALVAPERMVVIGPLDPQSRARLAGLPAARPAADPQRSGPERASVCGAPTQVTFGLAATGPAKQFVARRAPGRGMMGRREIEAALVAARTEEALRDRRVELIDVGSVAVLVDEGQPEPLEVWLERATNAAVRLGATPARGMVVLAEEALAGVAPAGPPSLGPPITVWYGDPAHFPTLPVMLTRDTPRCRP